MPIMLKVISRFVCMILHVHIRKNYRMGQYPKNTRKLQRTGSSITLAKEEMTPLSSEAFLETYTASPESSNTSSRNNDPWHPHVASIFIFLTSTV